MQETVASGQRFSDHSYRKPTTGRVAEGLVSEQGTAGRCQWCQKLLHSEMLTRTWLGS
jgi:hypothetical protein